MADDIFATVQKITVEKLGVKPEEVTLEARFSEDLGADSLDVVELVMNLEDECGVDIPDDDVGGLKSVGDVVDYITKRKNG